MRIRIRIDEIKEVSRKAKTWVKVADTGNMRDGGSVYDWSPEISVTETKTDTIFEQTLDVDNIRPIVAVANRLETPK
jgi:hypothetical protein